jgi:hypothetical protein
MSRRHADHPEFDFDAEPEEAAQEEPRSAQGTASAAVLERIKKLLRLAADKRGNAHECERAAALAFDLAERHHVDVASLNLDEQCEQLVGEYFKFGSKLDLIRQRAIAIVATFFHVDPCISYPRVLFVGRETDVQIAGYVYEFLCRAARDCLKGWEQREKEERRKVTTLKRKNYIAGFYYGISSQLSEARQAVALDDAKHALVVAEEVKRKAKLDELVPNQTTVKAPEPKRRNPRAIVAGWRDGNNTKIHSPLNGSRKETLALPA